MATLRLRTGEEPLRTVEEPLMEMLLKTVGRVE